MNRNQKIVLYIGLLLILAMSAYPPWLSIETKTTTPFYSDTITRPGSYGFILAPPLQAVVIDLRRLGVQLVAVSIITVGLTVSLMDKKKNP